MRSADFIVIFSIIVVHNIRISFLGTVPAQIEEGIRSKKDEGSNSTDEKIKHCLCDDQHIVQLSHFRVRHKHHDNKQVNQEAKQTQDRLKFTSTHAQVRKQYQNNKRHSNQLKYKWRIFWKLSLEQKILQKSCPISSNWELNRTLAEMHQWYRFRCINNLEALQKNSSYPFLYGYELTWLLLMIDSRCLNPSVQTRFNLGYHVHRQNRDI